MYLKISSVSCANDKTAPELKLKLKQYQEENKPIEVIQLAREAGHDAFIYTIALLTSSTN